MEDIEKKRIIPGYVHYLNQKHNIREWDDETIENWSQAFDGMERMEAWFKKVGRMLLLIFLVLIAIATLAFIGYGLYFLYQIGAYKLIAIILCCVILVAAIHWLRCKWNKSRNN